MLGPPTRHHRAGCTTCCAPPSGPGRSRRVSLVEWQLVKEYATSRNAVREALQLLAAEGLVTRGTREGTRSPARSSAFPWTT